MRLASSVGLGEWPVHPAEGVIVLSWLDALGEGWLSAISLRKTEAAGGRIFYQVYNPSPSFWPAAGEEKISGGLGYKE